MQGKKPKIFFYLVALALLFTCASFAGATELGFYRQGDVNLNGPSYGWWYGCTATSAGMMMGYYDQKGYGGLNYTNLVPGGVAEVSTVYQDPARNALVKDVIASQGHVNDYYRYWNGTSFVPDNNAGNTAYGGSGDDVAAPTHANNSLADFMGTNQDSVGNSNGSTTLYYFTNGVKLYAKDAFDYGISQSDGMYGMAEYLQYAGYGGNPATDMNFFTAAIDAQAQFGFTFAEYKAEIDAGRVVMIQVEGHSMFGYGYNDPGQIIFDDTWGGHNLLMNWGGSYSGMDQWGVTCFTPSGGTSVVPLPPSVYFMGSGLLGLLASRIRSRN